MFQNFDLDSGLSVYALDFSDKKIVSFKIYNVTGNFMNIPIIHPP